MSFLRGLSKIVVGVAAGIAVVTVVPLAAVGLGAAGVITAVGTTVGAVSSIHYIL